jgi:hypothetical protein
MTHSLLLPETMPAKGEVSSWAASSIALCRVLSCELEAFPPEPLAPWLVLVVTAGPLLTAST